jgi:hypothetical protein
VVRANSQFCFGDICLASRILLRCGHSSGCCGVGLRHSIFTGSVSDIERLRGLRLTKVMDGIFLTHKCWAGLSTLMIQSIYAGGGNIITYSLSLSPKEITSPSTNCTYRLVSISLPLSFVPFALSKSIKYGFTLLVLSPYSFVIV